MNYTITQKYDYTDKVFIRIDSDDLTVCIERFIPNNKILRDEVEDMVAELEIKHSKYVTPEIPEAKTKEEIDAFRATLRPNKIAEKKAEKLSKHG